MFSIRFDRAMSTQNIQTGEMRFGQKETNVRVRPRHWTYVDPWTHMDMERVNALLFQPQACRGETASNQYFKIREFTPLA